MRERVRVRVQHGEKVKLPQNFLDDLLARTDIIEIIEQRISIKKTGQANYQGLCPFHNEKTPSFSVNKHKQFYYCFGCKANGNAIGFLMDYDKLSFLEAVDILANRAGLTVPEVNTPVPQDEKTHLELLAKAATYYRGELGNNKAAGEYLVNRGLSQEIIEHFSLGFAPTGWRNICHLLGSTLQIKHKLQEVGLIKKKGDSYYDTFRERIIFPIHNKKGQIIAFGGRSLGEQLPKYLNSPETPVFHKSRELYGLYQALKQNRQLNQLIIVEGYLDVITLHQYGVTNTVATLGTAINSNHIHLLLRHANQLIFCFDGDLAGGKAAWRALEIMLPLMNEGIDVRFLFLPKGEDPDSFIRARGKDKFLEDVTQAVPLTDFFFKKLLSSSESESIAGKTRLVHLANKKLRHIPKGIFQELMYDRLANIVGISSTKIVEILEQQQPIQKNMPQAVTYDYSKISTAVQLVIRLLLQSPPLFEQLIIPPAFEETKIEGIDIIHRLLAIIKQNPKQTTGCLLEHFSKEPIQNLLVEFAAQDLLIPDRAWQEELQGAIERIIAISKEEEIQKLLAKGSQEGLSMEEKLLLQRLLSTRK